MALIAAWTAMTCVVAPIAAVASTVAVFALGYSCSMGYSCSEGSSLPDCLLAVGAPVAVVGVVCWCARSIARAIECTRTVARATRGTWMLRTHLAVVAALLFLFVAATVPELLAPDPSSTAAIAYALIILPLEGLGLPWTALLHLCEPGGRIPPWPVTLAALLGPALINVGLHAALLRVRRRHAATGSGCSPARERLPR